jgi:hypothetical protein
MVYQSRTGSNASKISSSGGEQILNYFAANNYTRVSFERLGSLMKFAEEDVRELIAREPSLFRHALIKGDKPGIGLVKKRENTDG